MAKLVITIDLDKLAERSSDTELTYGVYTILKQLSNTVFEETELESFAFSAPDDANNESAPLIGNFILTS